MTVPFGNELLGGMVVDHAEQLDAHHNLLVALQEGHEVLGAMQEELASAVTALMEATQGLQDIVRRHDDTLRRIHRGLHSTSDPEMYPVIDSRTPRKDDQ